MVKLNDITVEEITDTFTVYSPKGKNEKINSRKTYGISFCKEGQITYTYNGKKFISDNRHVMILPMGQSYELHGDKTGTFWVINFTCARPLTDEFAVFSCESADGFIKYFDEISKLSLFRENRSKILSVFYDMIHNLSINNSAPTIITPAIKYIEKNYIDINLSNKKLAEICNISEVYFRKLFKKYIKTTPKKYICDLKLNRAKKLLKEGILKINAVSEACGFDTSYNFCRFFKDKTGLTPTEYAKQNKNRLI